MKKTENNGKSSLFKRGRADQSVAVLKGHLKGLLKGRERKAEERCQS